MATFPTRDQLTAREADRVQREMGRMSARDRAEFEAAARDMQPARPVLSRPALTLRQTVRANVAGALSLFRAFAASVQAFTGIKPTLAGRPVDLLADKRPPTGPGAAKPRQGKPPQVPPSVTVREYTTSTRAADEDFNGGDWQYSLGSSNVHSMRYDAAEFNFYVRFLGGSSDNRFGPGQEYIFRGVDPLTAKKLLDGGDGIAVWDYLRIRGTMLTRYDYNPISSGSSPPPRKATGFGFKPRIERGKDGKEVRSNKPGTGMFKGDK